jgi:hypothetical protein
MKMSNILWGLFIFLLGLLCSGVTSYVVLGQETAKLEVTVNDLSVQVKEKANKAELDTKTDLSDTKVLTEKVTNLVDQLQKSQQKNEALTKELSSTREELKKEISSSMIEQKAISTKLDVMLDLLKKGTNQ